MSDARVEFEGLHHHFAGARGWRPVDAVEGVAGRVFADAPEAFGVTLCVRRRKRPSPGRFAGGM